MIKERKTSDEIFNTNFHSAEGWYSQLVFKTPGASVKIIGRGFDDFFREPVVLSQGRLTRCSLEGSLSDCIDAVVASPQNISYRALSPIKVVDTRLQKCMYVYMFMYVCMYVCIQLTLADPKKPLSTCMYICMNEMYVCNV